MKVLILGAGDLGTEVGLRLTAAGHHVTAWRRRAELLPKSFASASVDLGDDSVEFPVIDPDTELVIFTPAAAERSSGAYTRTYLVAARRILAALDRDHVLHGRFILVSSTAVYGDAAGGWVDENTPVAPPSPSAQILAETESVMSQYPGTPIILRLAGIYGPGRNHLIEQVKSGVARTPSKTFWTNRIHRDDAAAALIHLGTMLHTPEPLYLGVDHEPADLGLLHEFLAHRLNVSIPAIGEREAKRGGDRRLSNARLLASGFSFAFPTFREGYSSVIAGEGIRHP
ncbi:NAD(P)-dependent oxidoreductase [Arthrobacter sp. MYb227]|uniref:NAD-dependent epimerase/dehydratase family protein n=1 Tax=Arthrobacter sp. MYb227 TaxID=1848601 RepID=UPI000CFDD341|nr:NAD-dependent epimerase/dehydratase family protein [Arthrobacter sp. MYb227]PQZ86672.1 NAD(P)-dependent oxidoreductase [Arthrobacter sp. MYb227]